MGSCGICLSSVCVCQFTDASAVGQDALIPSLSETVDAARDVYTQLGVRSYRVILVRTRWSGGERGAGTEEVIAETPILPTPNVSDMTALTQETMSVGTEEQGTVRVTEISARYTENDLLGLSAKAEPIPDDQSFYWEIQDLNGGPADSPRRRFIPKSAPDYDAQNLEWKIVLQRQMGDRTRMGEPQ